jgi:anti-sigma factor RsiW
MTPGTDTTGHPDVSEISELAEGLLPPSRTTDVRRHLAECASCAEVHAALEEIQELLGTLPGAAGTARMPDDVAARIDAALAAEALQDTLPAEDGAERESTVDAHASTGPALTSAPDTGVNVSRETSTPDLPVATHPTGRPAGDRTLSAWPSSHPRAFTGPGRKKRTFDGRRRTAVLGTLLTVAVVGAGGLMFQLLEDRPTGNSSASADAGAKTTPSGTTDAFSREALESQVTDLLTTKQSPGAEEGNTSGDTGNSPGSADENPQTMIQPSVVVPDCIRLGLRRDDDALGAAPGTYNGDAAYLVVLPDTSDTTRVTAYVVDATCVMDHTLTPGKVLLRQSYSRP